MIAQMVVFLQQEYLNNLLQSFMLSNNTWKKPDKHENTSNISFLGITVNFRKYFETSGADTCKKKNQQHRLCSQIVQEKRDIIMTLFYKYILYLLHSCVTCNCWRFKKENRDDQVIGVGLEEDDGDDQRTGAPLLRKKG